jgi:predicted DNA-binding protein (MmcQ/YjbR family)
VQQIGKTIDIEPPDTAMDPQDIDSMNAAGAQAILKTLRDLCVALPEVTESKRFGRPAWKAGTKTFCAVTTRAKRLMLHTWVVADVQATLTDDPRFQIPAYTGQNGWIRLDLEDTVNWKEVEALILGSYEHFAFKRMLSVLRSGTS